MWSENIFSVLFPGTIPCKTFLTLHKKHHTFFDTHEVPFAYISLPPTCLLGELQMSSLSSPVNVLQAELGSATPLLGLHKTTSCIAFP